MTAVHTVKSKEKISQNFVTFSECINFNKNGNIGNYHEFYLYCYLWSFSFVLYLSPIILVSYELPTRLSCHKFLPKWCIYLILYNFFVHKLPSASVLDERSGRNGEKASIIKQTWARRLFFHSSNTFLLSVCLITNMITNVLKMAQVAKWGGINNKADRGGCFFWHSNSS